LSYCICTDINPLEDFSFTKPLPYAPIIKTITKGGGKTEKIIEGWGIGEY